MTTAFQALRDPALLRRHLYIDGQWVAGDGAPLAVHNPASGELLGTVSTASADLVDRAIGAAAAALPAWRAKPAKQRAAILRRWYELILEHADDLARIMTVEQGKPLAEARGEILFGASFVEWFAEEGKRVYGEIVPPPNGDRRLLVFREPVGVCAAITPWNFPSAMLARKAAPALAAGCTLVVKPAEATPHSALALAELAERAGLPPGVLNIVLGDPQRIGEQLTGHPAVRKLSFTGSTRVGRLLLAQAAANVQKVSLELGGNAPFIVFADADLEQAVAGAIAAKYRNAGQVCVAVNRIFVHAALYDRFVADFVAATRRLVVGDGLDPASQVGPLINATALARVETLIGEAVAHGAQVAAGGRRHAAGELFFEPTVLTDVGPDARVVREEIFGPVVSIHRFTDDQAVLAQANATEYGLASYFYTRDIGRLFRIAEGLQFGMVAVNTPAISSEASPFGGIKASGQGREGSRHGIDDYLEYKTVWIAGL
ncbi:NAD-dependent succinate-semialdehyde dehydrogenase [Dechloromonas denitrificans]|uniref:NAD-dependent succinate-semialdehyde dehydrogenase n=1 Tax=Dechloromonas denitrificans TaxID=281362 RepID=UPI001CF8B2AE|nr:NAD-dependent succinate-semialdehyde dehydrogenase [Dechloromonas denitrificans]UCV05616.1 NAD-dependent succinate-semialdehyde dehydrogenase [Dechloromonas denitrificans]